MNIQIITIVAAISGMMILGESRAAMVKNAGFEDGFTYWVVDDHVPGNTDTGGFGISKLEDQDYTTYDNGALSHLGKSRAFFNSKASRGFTLTASVFEDDAATAQVISAGIWSFTVALGNHLDVGGYKDPADVSLMLGYLTVDDDLFSFMPFATESWTAVQLNEQIGNGHFRDYSVFGEIEAGDAAAGRPLAVQVRAASDRGLRTAIDNIRVSYVPTETLGFVL